MMDQRDTYPTDATSFSVAAWRERRMMGTTVSVQIATTDEQHAAAEAALDACFAFFEEVNARLSRFLPESEICALNRAAGDWFAASDLLYTATAAAVDAATTSGGLFNPTLLRQLEALGYDRDFAQLTRDTAALVEPASAIVGLSSRVDAWREIALDPDGRRIRLPDGAALDLGGIAKGWAADCALRDFCQPFAGALVNVGGDLRVHGRPQPGQPWTIGLRDPRSPSEAAVAGDDVSVTARMTDRATLGFSRGGLATSGAVRRWWNANGARAHHLLDPFTGQPMPLWTSADGVGSEAEPRIATVTALAPTAAQAEAATKIALARGLPDALHAVDHAWERWGAVSDERSPDVGVALIFILNDGRVAHSANLSEWLSTWGTDGAYLPMRLSGAHPLFSLPLGERHVRYER